MSARTWAYLREHARGAAVRFARMALAFVLAFGTTLGAQTALVGDAFAAGGVSVQDEDGGAGDVGGDVGGNVGSDTGGDTGGDTDGDTGGGAGDAGGEGDGAGDDAGGDTGGDSGGADDDPGQSGEDDNPHIFNIGVFKKDTTKDAFAFASEGPSSENEVRAIIEKRGGFIDFDAAILWDDGSDWEYDSGKVVWQIDDAGQEIARMSPSGILEARGVENGTVVVYAIVDGEYTADGADLVAAFSVELRGQTDTKYVKNIVICDDSGTPIDPSYRFKEGTLSTAMLELSARVTVHDPAKDDDADDEYLVTPSSGLSHQTDGELADLIWQSADERLGTVSEEGIYRPAIAATNKVYCVSTAGFDGSRIQAEATIDMPPSNGKEAVSGYHPQSTLTVKIFYADYPDRQVGEKKFTVDTLEALGTSTITYTALRGKEGYMTTTGRGPLLADVLKASGVNIDGVQSLKFGTADNYQGTASWDMLVEKNRYYFPNIDIGSYADGVQVAPMIAIDAYRNVGSDVEVHTDGMLDTRRFLLLFGAKAPEGSKVPETTTNLQVYNIHTLYVTLKGAPPAQKDGGKSVTVKFVDSVTGKVLKSETTADPDSVAPPEAPSHSGRTFKGWSKSVDANGNVTFTTVYDGGEDDSKKSQGSKQPSDSNGSGQDGGDDSNPTPGEADSGDNPGGGNDGAATTTNPNNAGQNDAGGQGTHDLVNQATGGEAGGASASAEQAQSDSAASDQSVTQLDPSKVTSMTPGRFSMLQAINKHPSNVADLMLENPFAPYVAPFFGGVFCAGGLEAGIAFRRQKRMPKDPLPV